MFNGQNAAQPEPILGGGSGGRGLDVVVTPTCVSQTAPQGQPLLAQQQRAQRSSLVEWQTDRIAPVSD